MHATCAFRFILLHLNTIHGNLSLKGSINCTNFTAVLYLHDPWRAATLLVLFVVFPTKWQYFEIAQTISILLVIHRLCHTPRYNVCVGETAYLNNQRETSRTLCSLSLVWRMNQKLSRTEIIYQRGDRKLKASSYGGLTGGQKTFPVISSCCCCLILNSTFVDWILLNKGSASFLTVCFLILQSAVVAILTTYFNTQYFVLCPDSTFVSTDLRTNNNCVPTFLNVWSLQQSRRSVHRTLQRVCFYWSGSEFLCFKWWNKFWKGLTLNVFYSKCIACQVTNCTGSKTATRFFLK